MIYLDSAATSLKRPDEVIHAVTHAMLCMGNPGRGAHEASLEAARTVYQADVFEKEIIEDVVSTRIPSSWTRKNIWG